MRYWHFVVDKQSIYGGVILPVGRFIVEASDQFPDLGSFLIFLKGFESEIMRLDPRTPSPVDDIEDVAMLDKPIFTTDFMKVWRLPDSVEGNSPMPEVEGEEVFP